MRVLIADDQERVRFALRVLLMRQMGPMAVGEAASAYELFAQIQETLPDLLLVDWELPGLAQADGLAALRRACPTSQVIVLSSRPGVRRAVLASGGDAFVSKGDPPERLLTVIRRCGTLVKEGGAYVAAE